MDIKVSNTEKSKNNLEKCMKVGPHTLLLYFMIFVPAGNAHNVSYRLKYDWDI